MKRLAILSIALIGAELLCARLALSLGASTALLTGSTATQLEALGVLGTLIGLRLVLLFGLPPLWVYVVLRRRRSR